MGAGATDQVVVSGLARESRLDLVGERAPHPSTEPSRRLGLGTGNSDQPVWNVTILLWA